MSDDMRALLDAARDAHEPTSDDRARVRSKLTARLGAAAFATSALAASSSTARAAIRFGFGAVTVGAAGLLLWAFSRAPTPAPALDQPPPPMSSPALELPQAEQAPEILEPAAVPVESLRVVAPAPPKSRVAPVATSSLEAEIALLRDAKKALDDGDPSRALVTLDEHERRFPQGVLTEERHATRVLALCSAGRASEARARGAEFLERYPRSPAAPRVRASCGQ